MKKAFKKVCSIILAIAILIVIPVTNGSITGKAHFVVTEIGDRTYRYEGYFTAADVTYYIESRWGGAAITDWKHIDEGYVIIYVPETLEGKPVVRLGQCAFADDVSFEGISLPSTLKEIGSYAFQNCTGLKSVTIPDSVETIENGAFSGCSNLSEINLGQNIREIYDDSFESTAYSCNEDNWEDGVLYIGDCLIEANSDIEGEYTVKEGTRVIAGEAFRECTKLTGINLPDSVKYINYDAFDSCSNLEKVNLGNGVTEISESAFKGCGKLKSINIPDSVVSIGNFAFSDCHLENVTGGNGIKSLGKSALDFSKLGTWINGGLYINNILCRGELNVYGKLIIEDGTQSIVPTALSGCRFEEIVIPDSIKTIGDSAFCNCSYLKKITIPDSVTSIGENAFEGCDYLADITIPNGVTSIGFEAFYGCFSITNITIPDSVTDIYANAFRYCHGLTSVTIGSGVTNIGENAFGSCSRLTSITIPDNVTKIGKDAFKGCSEVKSISIGSGVDDISGISFNSCSANLASIKVSPENKIFDSRNDCNAVIETATNTLLYGCKNTAFPDSVTNIGIAAFAGCEGLKDMTIPDNIISIGEGAFFGCTGLTSIVIPDSVTVINNLMFYECKDLTSVTIPNSVTSIGFEAFYGCKGLTSAVIPDSVISIGSGAFLGCTGLTDVTIGNGVTNIGSGAFCGCTSLEDVIIPDGVISIESSMFLGCTGLTSVTIPASVTSIGSGAFYIGNNLKDVYYTGTQEQWNEINIDELNENLLNAQIHYAEPAKTYTAKLMVDGKLYKEIEYNEGQKSISLPAVPEKAGYTGTWEPYSLTNGGTTINAVYTPNTYTATLKVDGKVYKEITYTYGQKSITLPEVPKKEGCTGAWESYSLTAGGITINAVYTPNTYTATLKVDGKVYKEITYTYGQKSITLPEVPKKDGCTGAWESYSLTAGGITINAIYTPVGNGKVKSVSIGNDIELKYKDSAKLNPVIKADSGVKYKVEYKSSDNSIATVDNNGNVYGAKAWGKKTATITCTVTDEFGSVVTDTANVTCGYAWWQWIIGILLFGWIWY